MEENGPKQVAEDQKGCEEIPDENRRDFVNKLVTAAGITALAGLASGALAATKNEETKTEVSKEVTQSAKKLTNGFRLEFTGRPIGEALAATGLRPIGKNPENARLTIEFTN